MRWPRRAPKEVHWQAELAARSASTAAEIEPAEPNRRARLLGKANRRFWEAVVPVGGVVAFATPLVGGRHTLIGIILLFAGLCVAPFQIAAGRRKKREQEAALLPTPEEQLRWELKSASHDLRWFLRNPPERATYARWLKTSGAALGRVSPEAAERWARADQGWSSTGPLVSPAELDGRRRLLIELYSKVASPEQIALLKDDLPHAPSARAITSS